MLYNNHKKIVQTPQNIMILNEMVHDARIIRMNQPHLPSHMRFWMGDSIGRWEGDTLIVDTTNFTDKTRFRGSSQSLHVVERFRRVDDKTLLYQFTVEDPDTWTRPWTAEYPWNVSDERLFEYACHEGNYSLQGILAGERLLDREKAEAEERIQAVTWGTSTKIRDHDIQRRSSQSAQRPEKHFLRSLRSPRLSSSLVSGSV